MFAKTGRYTTFEVEHYQFRRILRSFLINFKYRGLLPTMLGTVAGATRKSKLPILQDYLFHRQSGLKDWLDIGGLIDQKDLDVPEENRGSGLRYEATSEYELRYVLESLKIPYPSYNFIDYGSGKGIAQAIAAEYPFNAVTGIEYSRKLHLIAERNIEEVKRRGKAVCRDVTSQCGDAMAHELPNMPHVIYLFNSFGADILKVVLDRITTDLAGIKQPIYLLYNNPMQQETVEEHGFFHLIAKPMGGKWRVYSS
ncbi:MAG: hypothetical protein COB93_09295 [Sneathiella sp.]|nr:MAG: hypothetical protein COB93_09295 [Sneathiella sp.]